MTAREQAVVDAGASIRTLWQGQARGRIANQARNSLLRAGIRTIGTLTDRTAGDLMDRRHFGPGQLAEVQRVLGAAGLALKDEAAS